MKEQLPRVRHESASLVYDAVTYMAQTDEDTYNHARRVSKLAVRLAITLGIKDIDQLTYLQRAAYLHDIGKYDNEILEVIRFSGEHNQIQSEIGRKHPSVGKKELDRRGLSEYSMPAWDHHERWNGKGYPRGLAGEEISMVGRILAVVDVLDAICSDRPYQPAKYALKNGIDIITNILKFGKDFDPQLSDAFMQMVEKLDDTFWGREAVPKEEALVVGA